MFLKQMRCLDYLCALRISKRFFSWTWKNFLS